MTAIIELLRIFFDPLSVLFWIVIAVLTVVILQRIYRRENHDIVERDIILLESFAQVCTSSEYEATAGGRIPNYFDADKFLMMNTDLLEKISIWITEELRRYPFAKICFIEKDSGPIGMLSLVCLVGSKLRRPISTIRQLRDVEKMMIKGESINPGDQVVLVHDLIRSGFQILRAMHKLQKLGVHVIAVIALVDREEEKDIEFLKSGIKLISFAKLSEIQKYRTGHHTQKNEPANIKAMFTG